MDELKPVTEGLMADEYAAVYGKRVPEVKGLCENGPSLAPLRELEAMERRAREQEHRRQRARGTDRRRKDA